MKLCQLIERLQLPELCLKERLDIASQLRQRFSSAYEPKPPEDNRKSLPNNFSLV